MDNLSFENRAEQFSNFTTTISAWINSVVPNIFMQLLIVVAVSCFTLYLIKEIKK